LVLLLSVAAAAEPLFVADATGPILVDGVLDEESWALATPADDFVRYVPSAGGPAPGHTEVRFVQDERALYVGMRVTESESRIRARISVREEINSDDQIGVYLDTFHDRRSGYIFYLNPLGIQQDIRHNAGNWNPNWDTTLRSAGHVDDDRHGYTIELAIPWRSIKYKARGDAQIWGVILTRKIPGEGAKYAFPIIERDHPVLFSEGGELLAVHPQGRGSGLELQPSVTLGQDWEEGDDFESLDVEPWTDAVRPSLDVRYGLTPDLGVTGTINPDFSQVEADVADVRLNPQFAFQFPELRPFFLDGVDSYLDRSGTLYTRSIAEPLYGAKVTGREGSFALGVVHALDQSPLPSVHEHGTPGFDAEDIEGRQALTTVARGRVDAFDTGYVGWTLADKRIVPGTRSGTAGANDSAAVDVNIPLGGRWLAGGSSQHSLTSDGETTADWGTSSEASITREFGVGTGFLVASEVITEDFRRETGFMPQSGLFRSTVAVDHTFTPGHGIDTFAPFVEGELVEEMDGDRYRWGHAGFDLLVHGVHEWWGFAQLDERRLEDAEVDGWSLNAGYSGQVGAVLEWSPEVEVFRGMDFDTLGPAITATGTLTASVRATAGTRLDLTATATRHAPEGAPVETATLLRSRFNWQFTRRLGARIVVQHDRIDEVTDLENQLLLSGLVTWLDVPGTSMHVGWTEILDLETGETAERIVFLKGSVLFRL
jgi:hypothetical protein